MVIFLGYDATDLFYIYPFFAGISQSQSSSHLWQGTELIACNRLQEKTENNILELKQKPLLKLYGIIGSLAHGKRSIVHTKNKFLCYTSQSWSVQMVKLHVFLGLTNNAQMSIREN